MFAGVCLVSYPSPLFGTCNVIIIFTQFGGENSCFSERSDLVSCYKNKSDTRECDAFVQAMERCAKQSVMGSA